MAYSLKASPPLDFLLRTLVCLSQMCCRPDLPPTADSLPEIHFKCRYSTYGFTDDVFRFPVPDDMVPWSVAFPEYQPTEYTSSRVLELPRYADKVIADLENPKWNCVDGPVDRRSYTGIYDIVNGAPMNPVGRTGVCGRGVLGRWGPDHAADPVVTRWKRDEAGQKVVNGVTLKPILQVVLIRRKDSGEWAFPGGMVEPGEQFSVTMIREFCEEALNKNLDEDMDELFWWTLHRFFEQGQEIHRGYSDDPRNTDNAWVETIVYNFHDETGSTVEGLGLRPGDSDVLGEAWMDIGSDMSINDSHRNSVMKTALKHHAHW